MVSSGHNAEEKGVASWVGVSPIHLFKCLLSTVVCQALSYVLETQQWTKYPASLLPRCDGAQIQVKETDRK